ncbi:hypothetical protein LTR66_011189 [Elasticomyces elasticus]|nr:hypothetical protein LTR66_011189 [Elasticomyces elasticus]KAK4983871.1 hypothetical protein LTR50_006947 [Elasticomyces elasticus]
MSAVSVPDSVSRSASKKKKRSKKKGGDKGRGNNESAEANGLSYEQSIVHEDEEGEDDEPGSPRKTAIEDPLHVPTSPVEPPEDAEEALPLRNGHHVASVTSNDEDRLPAREAAVAGKPEPTMDEDTAERLDAMAKERESLRAEVSQLRQSLESIQGKHDEEVGVVQQELAEAQTAKEHAESQYRNLLGKVNTIRSQLGERLKADAEELTQARTQIEELREENRSLRESYDSAQASAASLSEENRHQAQQLRQAKEEADQLNQQARQQAEEIHRQAEEVAALRSRTNISQSNWAKERDDLIRREAFAREEFEAAKQAMQDWEVLAMEERSLRENLNDRVLEMEEQLQVQREAYGRAAAERDSQNVTVDGLQRALQDIQDARKRELRELVETSQAQLEQLRQQVKAAEEAASASTATLANTQQELERALPYEKEVKEKNLLIGKLRHEAVILNDHLTKALRFLKRGKPEDNVDRQIVTNHFIHFLVLDRSDPKKFQVLQLIAALLGWTEEQREQAGLVRAGASNTSLRVPLSPFRRTPSTPALSTDFMPTNTTGSKESLAELWSDFLEREAEAGGENRRGSIAQSQRSPSISSPVAGGSNSAIGSR